ncbi:MAG: hypothetical protein FWG21_02125 [Oscillospiraceae bacterium]|nr:hypothetical protein [Oscillospiraceae bacterium]
MEKIEYTICPITIENLDSVNQDCWQSREAQLTLLKQQEILGFGAWVGSICIGSLHCYRVTLPVWDDTLFPEYGRKKLTDWPLGWPLIAAKEKNLLFQGPVWGHSCFHVGRLLDTHHSTSEYIGKGIGKALLIASINWAKTHEYSAIIAIGGSKTVFEYNPVMGCLPWTSYLNNGFSVKAIEEEGKNPPWWIKEWDNKIINEQIDDVLAVEDDYNSICARLMVLDFDNTQSE